MNRDEIREKIIDDISQFGCGEMSFETKDIEQLIHWIDELRGELSNLTIQRVSVSDFIKDCKEKATETALTFEEDKMIESQHCSEAMAFAYQICLTKLNEH